MSKVLIFSDLHCHPHQKSTKKLDNCLEVVDWVFRIAKERKIKNILFGGDLFHDRQKIEVSTYCKVYERFLNNMSDDFNLYLLLGNHDLFYYLKTNITSVYPFSTIKGVKVISDPSTINVDGYEVSWLPYTHDPEVDLAKIKNDSKRKVLIGHVAVDGAIWNSFGQLSDVHVEHDGDMKKVTIDIFKGWDHVFLGHYHAEQKMSDSVEYIGSPLQLSWGEQKQIKHIIEFDLETGEKNYIENDFSPTHIKIKLEELDKYPDNAFDNHYIDILTEDTCNPDLIEIRQKLEDIGVGSIKFTPVEKDLKDQVKNIEDAKSILTSDGNIVEKYLEKAEVNGLDKDKLLKIGNEIILKSGA